MINYYLLTKPGIIAGNLVTFTAGFLLASHGVIDFYLFLAALFGLGLVMASACVFNNMIDLKIDQKMERTKSRPLVTGSISFDQAMIYATALGIFGNLILFFYVNLLSLFIVDLGFFVYVILYSLWKRYTVYGTVVGSIAGAIPPVVGYCAASNHFDAGAIILFLIMVLWQMPHFFAIAIYHFKDYAVAGIPTLPHVKGIFRTKIHMTFYILAFMGSATLLTVFGYTGYWYLMVAVVGSLIWLALCLTGFQTRKEQESRWGRQMFVLSLVIIMALSAMIPMDMI